jgi:hypothetical protein
MTVSLGLLLSVVTLMVLRRDNGASKLTVSFLNAEASYGPHFSNVECQRFAFAVRNGGKAPVPFVVSHIQDEHGSWVPSFHQLDEAAPGDITHLYLYLPKGSNPQAVRLRGYKKASELEKAQYALKLLREKVSGAQTNKQVWFEKMSVAAYEFILNVNTNAEQIGSSQ